MRQKSLTHTDIHRGMQRCKQWCGRCSRDAIQFPLHVPSPTSRWKMMCGHVAHNTVRQCAGRCCKHNNTNSGVLGDLLSYLFMHHLTHSVKPHEDDSCLQLTARVAQIYTHKVPTVSTKIQFKLTADCTDTYTHTFCGR